MCLLKRPRFSTGPTVEILPGTIFSFPWPGSCTWLLKACLLKPYILWINWNMPKIVKFHFLNFSFHCDISWTLNIIYADLIGYSSSSGWGVAICKHETLSNAQLPHPISVYVFCFALCFQKAYTGYLTI